MVVRPFVRASGKTAQDARGMTMRDVETVSASSKAELNAPPRVARLGLSTRYYRTFAALMVERLAPTLLLPFSLFALFIATSWSGLFNQIGPWERMGVTGLFMLAILASLWPLRRFSMPTAHEIEKRLDATRPDAHRPLHTLSDELTAKRDPFAAALWQEHQRRAEEAARQLSAASGDARLRFLDPYGLRAIALLALVASAFVAGDERGARFASAFDFTTPKTPPVPPRLDAWIDPPAYTARPPIFLTGAVNIGPDEVVRVPVGSVLTIRSTITMPNSEQAKPIVMTLQHNAGLTELERQAAADAGKKPAPAPEKPGVTTLRRVIQTDSPVALLRDGREVATFKLAVIPDLPPKAVLGEVKAEAASPERQTPGGIRLHYALEDDYGIAKADLIIERASGGRTARTLLPAPTALIPTRIGDGEIAIPTEDHPWAGEEVSVRMRVEDDLGQAHESESKRVILPRRPFSKPVPKALVEQRKNLVFDPDYRQNVLLAFDALLFAPERFTPNTGEFMAIDSLRAGIRTARNDDKLRDMVERIYDLAQFLENGDMTDAERRLREAEERLREALERDAPKDEIKRLTEDLRRAMDQFLREFAERALREQNNAEQDRSPSPTDRMITQRDLQDMLRKIEEMARSGNMAEAQRMLNELRQLMENLRSARRRDVDPTMRELGRQIEELERMQREQRDLRDRTFRQGQQRNQRGQQNQQGQRQPGQRGQQQGQQQGEDGENAESLQRQQQALRDRLQQLRDRLKQRGMEEKEGMGEAQEGMGEAEGQLGQGKPGDATQGQQRALDGLGKAAEGMMNQLQQQMGQGEGDGEGEPGMGQQMAPSMRGRAESRTDPLGRPQRTERRDIEENGRFNTEDALKGLGERADRVLRELRRRLGEFERPREELDYLERLLRQR